MPWLAHHLTSVKLAHKLEEFLRARCLEFQARWELKEDGPKVLPETSCFREEYPEGLMHIGEAREMGN